MCTIPLLLTLFPVKFLGSLFENNLVWVTGGEARKGRGFGFVTFTDEDSQRKAVEEMNGREVEGRAISVKVAIDKPKEEKEDGPTVPVTVPVATNGAA